MKLDKIFRTAVEYKASDVYITTGSKPVIRIHGDLVEVSEHEPLSEVLAEEYIYETMNDLQKETFKKNLDLDYAIELSGVARMRVNVFVQRKGIAAVFRIIPSKITTMDELGLPAQLKKLPELRNGIVLITGPTGSGKSTTLSSIVHHINTSRRSHIITIEDPIEFVHENKMSIIDQREINSHTRSFTNALRACLREDPDVLLIGEMRDLETISLALTAAETGHLVLATLHTSGAAKAIDRVIDAFPPDQQNQIRTQFSESLRAVVWQNLLKRRDGKGRVGAHEILFNNHAVANLIRKSKTFQVQSVLETGIQEGMQTMERSLKDLLSQGLISEETASEYMPAHFEI